MLTGASLQRRHAANNRESPSGASAAPSQRPCQFHFIYSVNLFDFARSDSEAFFTLEKILFDFLRSGETERMLPSMSRERRTITHQLAYYFNVKCDSHDPEPVRSCYLRRTAQSCLPPVLLSELLYSHPSPQEFGRSIFSDPQAAASQVIVFHVEGGRGLTEGMIYVWLRQKAGSFVVLPYPAQDGALAAVFISAAHCNAAFSLLRQSEQVSAVFRRCGENPPPKSGAEGEAVVPEAPEVVSRVAPSVAVSRVPGGWAAMLKTSNGAGRSTTARARHEDPGTVPLTENRFSVLKK